MRVAAHERPAGQLPAPVAPAPERVRARLIATQGQSRAGEALTELSGPALEAREQPLPAIAVARQAASAVAPQVRRRARAERGAGGRGHHGEPECAALAPVAQPGQRAHHDLAAQPVQRLEQLLVGRTPAHRDLATGGAPRCGPGQQRIGDRRRRTGLEAVQDEASELARVVVAGFELEPHARPVLPGPAQKRPARRSERADGRRHCVHERRVERIGAPGEHREAARSCGCACLRRARHGCGGVHVVLSGQAHVPPVRGEDARALACAGAGGGTRNPRRGGRLRTEVDDPRRHPTRARARHRRRRSVDDGALHQASPAASVAGCPRRRGMRAGRDRRGGRADPGIRRRPRPGRGIHPTAASTTTTSSPTTSSSAATTPPRHPRLLRHHRHLPHHRRHHPARGAATARAATSARRPAATTRGAAATARRATSGRDSSPRPSGCEFPPC